MHSLPNLSRRRLMGASMLAVAATIGAPVALAQSDLPIAVAINRSGLMRAMSQRMAKAYAQLALGIAPAAGRRAMAAARKVVTDAMGELALAANRDTVLAEPFNQLNKEMDALLALVHKPADRAQVLTVSDAADRVQIAADRMTEVFQSSAAAPTARIVNVAGRQRMLSQRMAKVRFVMAAGQRPDSLAQQLAESRTDFVQALQMLGAAPVTSAAIRKQLAAATAQWRSYDALLKAEASPRSLAALALASESILVTLDRLTSLYDAALRDLLG